MKPININNYDPDQIIGLAVNNNWWEALNMIAPVFIDPDVAEIYRMCLDWDIYRQKFVRSIYELNRERQIQLAVKKLILKYNPEGNINE